VNKLIIIGAGGSGREVLEWALNSLSVDINWDILGFLDDNLAALKGFNGQYPVLGSIDDWQPNSNERFVVSIGDPLVRENIVNSLKSKGAIFTNIVHESVILAKSSSLGEGVILAPFVVISDNAKISDHVSVNISTCVGHDAEISDYCTLSSHCDITGYVKIGRRTFVGSSAVMIPSTLIGENSYIGAGSVVMNNIKPGAKVFGNPAKNFAIKR
jgi:sugar O-acyltransferase (sialic acid O-acetyltransferase NeuD family)